MKDVFGLVLTENIFEKLGVEDRALVESNGFGYGGFLAGRKIIYSDDGGLWEFFLELLNKIATNKASTAGYQYRFRRFEFSHEE